MKAGDDCPVRGAQRRDSGSDGGLVSCSIELSQKSKRVGLVVLSTIRLPTYTPDQFLQHSLSILMRWGGLDHGLTKKAVLCSYSIIFSAIPEVLQACMSHFGRNGATYSLRIKRIRKREILIFPLQLTDCPVRGAHSLRGVAILGQTAGSFTTPSSSLRRVSGWG